MHDPFDMKSVFERKPVDLAPPGYHNAAIIGLSDMGEVETEWKGKKKPAQRMIRVFFAFCSEGQPHTVSKAMSFVHMGQRTTLFALFSAALGPSVAKPGGRPPSARVLIGLDPETGKFGMPKVVRILVDHGARKNEQGEEYTYARIAEKGIFPKDGDPVLKGYKFPKAVYSYYTKANGNLHLHPAVEVESREDTDDSSIPL